MKGFFNLLKNFFTKGEVRDQYEYNQKRRNIWAVWDSMENAFYESIWENTTPDVADFDRMQAAVQDFAEIIQEIRDSGDIAKALEGKPESIGKGENHMKKEEIEKLLDEKLSPITKRLEDIEKEEGVDDNSGQDDDALKQLEKVLDEKLAPINDRLETVEKARGVSKQADVEPSVVEKSEGPSYMRHFG